MGLLVPPLYASDISASAVSLAAANASAHGVEFEGRCGSLFEPWTNMRFDYIIDDVSGIAEDIARLSPWFQNDIPCDSGADGTALTTRVLDQAGSHLEEGGVLLVPVISLSDASKILARALEEFGAVQEVASQRWNCPKCMFPHLDLLREAKSEGRIEFEEKFGAILFCTKVYACTMPVRPRATDIGDTSTNRSIK